MELTKEQRIEAYEYAAAMIDEGARYICHLCIDYINKYLVDVYNQIGYFSDVSETFPELYMFKQVAPGYMVQWFTDAENGKKFTKESRLFILGSCILMAKEEIENSKPHLAEMAM